MSNSKTVGSFEIVSIPEFGIVNQIAKIDTGAYSGALHCTNIKVVRNKLTGKRSLRFTPAGNAKHASSVDEWIATYVRSASGHRVRRYLIDTEIELQGTTYPIRIGLSDRKELSKMILIGRRFLREQDMLVNVKLNQEYDEKKGDEA